MKTCNKLLYTLVIFCITNSAFTIPAVVSTYFPYAPSLGNNKYGGPNYWFGTFTVESDTSMWINHSVHGRLLAYSIDSNSYIKFYDQAQNWLWGTSEDDWPWIYSYSTGEDLYFDEANSYRDATPPYQTHRKWHDTDNVLWTDDRSHIPTYYGQAWNSSPEIDNNNCYSYACNVFCYQAAGGSAPGGGTISLSEVSAVHAGLLSDDALTQLPAGPSNRAKIALYYRPGGYGYWCAAAPYYTEEEEICFFLMDEADLEDCEIAGYGVTYHRQFEWHFIREDRNGNWSQKPGNGPNFAVTNQDDSGYMTSATGFIDVYDILTPYTDPYTEYQLYPSYGGIYYVITAPEQGQSTADIEYSSN